MVISHFNVQFESGMNRKKPMCMYMCVQSVSRQAEARMSVRAVGTAASAEPGEDAPRKATKLQGHLSKSSPSPPSETAKIL